jgi:RNA polymerase sigma-70 factor (family 1)
MQLSLHDTVLWEITAQEQELTLPAATVSTGYTAMSQKFNRIFVATKDRLYHFVWKLTQHETDTKDVIQNCYTQLWQKIETVDDTCDVLPLLFTYARNLVIDHLRKKARQRALLDQLQQDADGVTEISSTEQLINYKERLHQLQTTIDLLPAKRKEIFTLVKQEGLSHKKVADQLGISPATVEKQVCLSLQFLRKQMGRKS